MPVARGLLAIACAIVLISGCAGGSRPGEPGCTTCDAMTDIYTYGLGIIISGNWLLQNPLMAGYSAVEAYLPSQKIAIAVAATYAPDAFDDQGSYGNAADTLFRKIGAALAPDDAPPMPPPK